MCDCMSEIMKKMVAAKGYESISSPVEILSGRAYLSFTVREQGKKKDKEIPLLLSKCPFCGEPYETEK